MVFAEAFETEAYCEHAGMAEKSDGIIWITELGRDSFR